MFSSKEILDFVDGKDTRANIARVLGLPAPRITELYKGRRKLSADEAKLLADHYKMKPPAPVSLASCQLLVLHCAGQLGVHPDNGSLDRLAEDIGAFIKFASVRELQIAEAEAFLAGMAVARKG